MVFGFTCDGVFKCKAVMSIFCFFIWMVIYWFWGPIRPYFPKCSGVSKLSRCKFVTLHLMFVGLDSSAELVMLMELLAQYVLFVCFVFVVCVVEVYWFLFTFLLRCGFVWWCNLARCAQSDITLVCCSNLGRISIFCCWCFCFCDRCCVALVLVFALVWCVGWWDWWFGCLRYWWSWLGFSFCFGGLRVDFSWIRGICVLGSIYGLGA